MTTEEHNVIVTEFNEARTFWRGHFLYEDSSPERDAAYERYDKALDAYLILMEQYND